MNNWMFLLVKQYKTVLVTGVCSPILALALTQ